MTASLFPVILCGGSGTRLWPLSRSSHPKQFVEFEPGKTLFNATVERVKTLPNVTDPVVVCNRDHRFLAKENLATLQCSGTIIVEPVARNTAPAIALAALEVAKKNPEAILMVLPSDHLIQDKVAFAKAVGDAVRLAEKDYLVTYGVVPTGPETGFGYIAKGEALEPVGFQVARFVEKPTLSKAQEFIADGGYLWNSGMFVFKASMYLQALTKHAPEMMRQCRAAVEQAKHDSFFVFPDEGAMQACPSNSIDYAVMEKAEKVAAVPLDLLWNDLGTWSALYQIAKKDSSGNASVGDAMAVSSSNCYLHSTGRLIAAVGIENVAVVETADSVMVAPLSRVQEVKTVVSKLQEMKRCEVETPPVVRRPWGTYENLAYGDQYKVKRIVVNPGQALSLQYHQHRSEHWTIVSGEAWVTVGDVLKKFSVNESVYIPVNQNHRLENRGSEPTILIEVQSGDYLGEDDIVRLSDLYERNQ